MVRITIEQNGEKSVIRLDGHAMYGSPDILCASISALTYALAAAHDAEGTLLEHEDGNGYEKIVAKNNTARARAFNDMAARGYAALAKNYPNNITYTGA